jgi:hypothetical protein
MGEALNPMSMAARKVTEMTHPCTRVHKACCLCSIMRKLHMTPTCTIITKKQFTKPKGHSRLPPGD